MAFGKNAAVPHHETGETKLKDNECVLMDFGCLYKGYCSDMTRTMFYGEPTEAFRKAYLAVLTAHTKAAEGIKEGISGKEADKIARDVAGIARLRQVFHSFFGTRNRREHSRISDAFSERRGEA